MCAFELVFKLENIKTIYMKQQLVVYTHFFVQIDRSPLKDIIAYAINIFIQMCDV